MSERKPTPDVLAGLLGGMDSQVSDSMIGELSEINVQIPEKPKTKKRSESAPEKRTSEKPSSARSSNAIAKTQLEHSVATFQEHRGWRLRFVDGRELRDWSQGRNVQEYIAEMTADGWEIAAACSGQAMFGALDKYQLFFKRRH